MKFKMLTDAELQQTSEPLAAKLQKQQRSFFFILFFFYQALHRDRVVKTSFGFPTKSQKTVSHDLFRIFMNKCLVDSAVLMCLEG